MKNYFDLSNKVIVVTGGAGLIGKEICKGLVNYGAEVIVADVNKEEAIKFSEGNNKLHFIETDITSKDSIENLITKIQDKFNKVDCLINNAYPRNKNYGNKFEDINIEDWRENVDMHLNGYFLITQLFVELMKNQDQGNIINIGSIYGMKGPNFNIYENTKMTSPAEYSVIKGGILNFTRYLASYLGEYNIRVNSLSPGGVFDNQNENFVKNYCDNVPLGRMASAEDIVGGIVYLVSDASKYVNGHNLVIDGGWSIC